MSNFKKLISDITDDNMLPFIAKEMTEDIVLQIKDGKIPALHAFELGNLTILLGTAGFVDLVKLYDSNKEIKGSLNYYDKLMKKYNLWSCVNAAACVYNAANMDWLTKHNIISDGD